MPNDKEQNELLLTAYLDGELDHADVRIAEGLLDDPEYAELIASWKSNRDMLKSLPKYRLKDSFTEEVLTAAKIEAEAVEAKSKDSVQLAGSCHPFPFWRNALGAVAALAALVFVFLYVLLDSASEPIADLTNDTSPPIVSPPIVSPPKSPDSEDVNPIASDSTSKKAERAELPVIEDPGRFNSEMLFSSRENADSKGASTSQIVEWADIAEADAAGSNVVRIKMSSESGGMADLERILASNKIEIQKSLGDERAKIADQILARSTKRLKMLHVVSTTKQMKEAIAELTAKKSVLFVRHPQIQPVRIEPQEGLSGATDRQVNADDREKIAELDRWFGLTSKTESTGRLQYLLVIDSAK